MHDFLKQYCFLISALLFTSNAFAATSFELTSAAFKNGDTLPALYTCNGKNISPPLSWQGAPSNTQSFVLIMNDPDHPGSTWDHWIVFNIPAAIHTFPENMTTLPTGALYGSNSWNKAEYDGPCPPSGEHHYIFTLYALDNTLSLTSTATSAAIQSAMRGHVVNSAVLAAKYSQQK